MKALIFNENVVQVEEQEFEVAPTLFWVDCSNEVAPGWGYVNNQFVAPSAPQPPTADENKAKAEQLLTQSDWTQLPDVNLLNKNEFATYRAELRQIAINPVAGNIDFPTKPNEIWE